MAKTKRKRERREPPDEPHPSERTPPANWPYLADADPPRPHRPLLVLAALLVAAWLAFLAFVALVL